MTASSWIRGVNLGGWLLAERFITPYLFAVNSCQLRGDFCFHPDQIGSPPTSSRQHVYCDLNLCQPHLIDDPTESDAKDYPMDEKSLLGSFDNKAVAKQYMTFHWENFVQKDDVQFLSKNNIEYVKVPMPHYVMNDILDNEPWVDGQWLFFPPLCRMVQRIQHQNLDRYAYIFTRCHDDYEMQTLDYVTGKRRAKS